jgi:murein DD-endopeptidase MepM/ murein hydrolase activator NlpD
MYILLASIFFVTLFIGFFLLITFLINRSSPPRVWRRVAKGYVTWLAFYFLFIAFGTGPSGEPRDLSPESSLYKLPWKANVARFVSQGNRSFTSHRGTHLYAWDFWMPVGTEVVAAREGQVVKIEQNFRGIGLNSNFIVIQHRDETRAMYAHIKTGGAVAQIGESVRQGQLIAYSGMVGQTINPHLHFVVFNKDESASLPVTFSDVSGGVPLAGRFYVSGNGDH